MEVIFEGGNFPFISMIEKSENKFDDLIVDRENYDMMGVHYDVYYELFDSYFDIASKGDNIDYVDDELIELFDADKIASTAVWQDRLRVNSCSGIMLMAKDTAILYHIVRDNDKLICTTFHTNNNYIISIAAFQLHDDPIDEVYGDIHEMSFADYHRFDSDLDVSSAAQMVIQYNVIKQNSNVRSVPIEGKMRIFGDTFENNSGVNINYITLRQINDGDIK